MYPNAAMVSGEMRSDLISLMREDTRLHDTRREMAEGVGVAGEEAGEEAELGGEEEDEQDEEDGEDDKEEWRMDVV